MSAGGGGEGPVCGNSSDYFSFLSELGGKVTSYK